MVGPEEEDNATVSVSRKNLTAMHIWRGAWRTSGAEWPSTYDYSFDHFFKEVSRLQGESRDCLGHRM